MRQVITVSRQIGTDGDEVAREAANFLGFEYIDKRLITERAAGVLEE